MKIEFRRWRPTGDTLQIVETAEEILEDYSAKGYRLTLRQLYYQFVARDLLPNTQKSYSRLGDIVSRARDAGLLDWDQIADRGRIPRTRSTWPSPGSFIRSVAGAFQVDLWRDQRKRVEVWVEKDALSEIVEQAAEPWGVVTFANRGYVSSSAMFESSRRALEFDGEIDEFVVLHFGDHDPSGIDMSRDIADRLNLYVEDREPSFSITVQRVALTMAQIKKNRCPPNPAKKTDARFENYRRQFGPNCWELDALPPEELANLVDDAIAEHCERERLKARVELELRGQGEIAAAGAAMLRDELGLVATKAVETLHRKKKGKKGCRKK